MKSNKIIKQIPKYTLFEKEITENAILDNLISDGKFTHTSFSYKTETLIQFMYYCLTYFFKNRTYGESLFNIELYDNNDINAKKFSYLFKFKIILPKLFKLIIKYLSTKNNWFNFIFHGIELINLIQLFEMKNNECSNYNSLLNYLLNLKYRFINDKENNIPMIFYSNWLDIFINGISDIIADILSSNLMLYKIPKKKLSKFLGFNNNIHENEIYCQICKQIPTNLLSFKCGHYYCYYCYYYNFILRFPDKNIEDICYSCK